MTRLIFIATMVFFIVSCNNTHNHQTIEYKCEIDSVTSYKNKDTLPQSENKKDTLKVNPQIKTAKINTKNKKKKKVKVPPPLRISEFPRDENLNGRPMTQQEDISKDILEKHPDTLSKIAIARYKAFANYFPTSIEDNFEKGISVERIHYPQKLTFRFELFENEDSLKPFFVKEVTVRRNPNGEPYTD